MPRNCCHTSLAFLLKLFNFLQAFVGVSILVYSLWMLNQWNHHVPISPPSPPSPTPSPSAPSPYSSFPLLLDSETIRISDQVIPLSLPHDAVSGWVASFEFGLNSFNLPAPWFIYSFMGVGTILCYITLIGCIAAESINGCCLCFYTLLKTVLMLVEVALVAFIAFDHQWEKAIPFDPTGELESFQSFIEKNVDICKWVGIVIVIIQVLSLLLSIILRAMISPRRADYDGEDDYVVMARTREPLLNPQSNQTSGVHTWSSRMREKYGLGSGDRSLNQSSSITVKTTL